MLVTRQMEHLTCTACELHKGRIRVVPGCGPKGAKLALVGESPGREEDESGVPFVGMAGKFLIINHDTLLKTSNDTTSYRLLSRAGRLPLN